MAHLCVREVDGWAPVELRAETVALETDDGRVRPLQAADEGDDKPLLMRLPTMAGGACWIVLAKPDCVKINGESLALGARVLEHRDQLRLAGMEPFYFSSEDSAAVQPFPGSERPAVCPRCRCTIEKGAPAVRCPACGIWHHEDGDMNCFTYEETCAACGAKVSTDGDYQWTPEE